MEITRPRLTTLKSLPAEIYLPNRQLVLLKIQEQIGGKQVYAVKLGFAPKWVLEEAFETEMIENWKGAYELVNEKDMSPRPNKVGCHTVYQVKDAPTP